MPDNCIFCRIVAAEIPAQVVYQDDAVVAIHDIHPQAPVHVLVMPREHVASLDELREREDLAGAVFARVPRVAAGLGLENGYRTVVNVGEEGGQTVPHLHVHILGGRSLGEGMLAGG